MAVPTVVGTWSATSRTFTLPAGILAGDVLLLNVTANQASIVTLALAGWATCSPVNLGRAPGWALTDSYPSALMYRNADGTEGGTTLTVVINGGGTGDAAVSGVVVRGARGAVPTVASNAGYPWFTSAAVGSGAGVTNVPAVAVAAATCQLVTPNGQENSNTQPVYTYTGGFVAAVAASRWFPACGWASQGFAAPGPGVACTVTQRDTNNVDPDPYCWVVNVAVPPPLPATSFMTVPLRHGSGLVVTGRQGGP